MHFPQLPLVFSYYLPLRHFCQKILNRLLGEDGRQRLTEMIYFAETIPDGILETLMEHSPARDTVTGALLELLRTRRLLLI